MPARPPRRELVERVAQAFAGHQRGFGKSLRELFDALKPSEQDYVRSEAQALLYCLRKAGLVVTVRGRRKRG